MSSISLNSKLLNGLPIIIIGLYKNHQKFNAKVVIFCISPPAFLIKSSYSHNHGVREKGSVSANTEKAEIVMLEA